MKEQILAFATNPAVIAIGACWGVYLLGKYVKKTETKKDDAVFTRASC